MEIVVSTVEDRHLGVGDGDALWIEVVVDLAADGEAGLGGGGRNQVDDDAIADEWLGAPVLADEREQAVLDPRLRGDKPYSTCWCPAAGGG